MVETIIAAIIGGIVAGAGKVATKEVENAYNELRAQIVGKLGENSEAASAITKLELQPNSKGRTLTLAEELTGAGITADIEFMEAAQKLQTALNHLPVEDRTHVQTAVGSYIAQADRGATATVIAPK